MVPVSCVCQSAVSMAHACETLSRARYDKAGVQLNKMTAQLHDILPAVLLKLHGRMCCKTSLPKATCNKFVFPSMPNPLGLCSTTCSAWVVVEQRQRGFGREEKSLVQVAASVAASSTKGAGKLRIATQLMNIAWHKQCPQLVPWDVHDLCCNFKRACSLCASRSTLLRSSWATPSAYQF